MKETLHVNHAHPVKQHKVTLLQRIWQHKVLYLMLLPCLLFFLIFNYIPMAGLVLAFKEFRFDTTIFGGQWEGFKYFKRFFSDSQSYQIIINTLIISGMKLVLALPFPIALAIMFNEISHTKKLGRFHGLFQGVMYIPHFLSWVVVVGIFQKVLAPDSGLINQLIQQFGGNGATFFMMNPEYFHTIMFSSYLWKNVGWDSIIYFAAIMGINPEIYESAKIDGANRWQQIIHITLPMLTPTIIILFILSLGDILKAGFDQIYLLKTPGNAKYAEILDTFVIRTGIQQGDFSYSIAIGLLQGVIGLILVIVVNRFADRKFNTSLY
ncbi:ABC transporter permease [Staphylococcus lugdunensis]|uniref:ABC transporter permease n=1 Tax=Staphylococcus lugdunensis TaxID=28035 RepID=UPI00076B08EC|nr:sugar ABC transporter permease [Staphylococcus lugdunensis]MDU0966000.1 ABC transporter permease subunit [Staphylococcus lugdunensis]MDU1965124.1 ABC transporter permease subunit [Staphylococcus lugdunensis]